ncbi:hypothetical protein SAMN05444959_1424 [Paracoccus seriniphilus]|uniref:Uncharacterized protein n=2 Tax=Paracoccus seriniphilus TaxID=184748 RepID=A0A239Q2V3_9RHOB|nr:hypothetical protein [Paracoccus seriniphilus]SNT76929.1 hypothetical protein SAMN05444959_1424 [Paracoccus seriniphilus]
MLDGLPAGLAWDLHEEATRLLALLPEDSWNSAVLAAQMRFLRPPGKARPAIAAKPVRLRSFGLAAALWFFAQTRR